LSPPKRFQLSSELRLIATALAGACIAFSGCSSHSPQAGESGIAAWLGPDTVAIAGIRLDQLRAGPLAEAFPAEWLAPLSQFTQATQVWAGYDGKDLLVIARGPFPPAPPGAVLVGPGFALAGSSSAIQAAQQRRASVPDSASRLLEKAEPLQNQPIWAVIRGDARLPLHGNGANVIRALEFTQYTAASARWNSAIELSLTGYCATAKKAQDLEESLRAMVTLGRKAARAAGLKATLESVRMDRQQTKVLVSLTAPAAVIREMLR
jgi:hypothetical protein